MAFHSLSTKKLTSIVDIQIERLARRLDGRCLGLDVTNAAREWLALGGLARPAGAPVALVGAAGAEQDNEWSADDEETARKLIGDLVLVIRGLLIEHKLQRSGNCRICPSAWLCPVVTTIHAFVKDPQRQFAALFLRARDEG